MDSAPTMESGLTSINLSAAYGCDNLTEFKPFKQKDLSSFVKDYAFNIWLITGF